MNLIDGITTLGTTAQNYSDYKLVSYLQRPASLVAVGPTTTDDCS